MNTSALLVVLCWQDPPPLNRRIPGSEPVAKSRTVPTSRVLFRVWKAPTTSGLCATRRVCWCFEPNNKEGCRMTEPLRTMPGMTPDQWLEEARAAYWNATRLDLAAIHLDTRTVIAPIRAAWEAVLDKYGCEPGPCPWAGDDVTDVGEANPGFSR
jgi:hypothetical protein